MSVTIAARAGSSFVREFHYLGPDEVTPINTTASTARFSIRSNRAPYRIIAVVDESPTDAAISFKRLRMGVWELSLSRSATKSLPPVARWELELINNADSDKGEFLASGIIKTQPEVVTT